MKRRGRPAGYRHVPAVQQRARQAELDLIRLQRRLTTEEQDEADRLAAREQMRAWRQRQRDIEHAIAAKAACPRQVQA